MTYVRYATRAQKRTVDLTPAQDRALVASQCVALTILDKGTGTFTLIVIFPDRSELELTQDEVLNGDVFQWDMAEIRITNAAQAAKSVKLIVDQQVLAEK